jgi:hypothetical protein
MTTRSYFAAAVMAMACLQAGPLLAQSAPVPDSAATPAPAASPATAATPAPGSSPAAASTDKAGASDGQAANEEAATPRAKKPGRTSTRQELAHSLKTGTVPSRFRSQVPKKYQKYIPFDR